MLHCPYCQRSDNQIKAGKNASGTQRYKCVFCKRSYTLLPGTRAYPEAVREEAIQLHTSGMRLREIARRLHVNHQSVANWLRAAAETGQSDEKPEPSPIGKATDELVSPVRRANIGDVARRANVSISTVSNFLNGKMRMAAQTRRRVEEAIEDLHFTPSALAKAIRERRTRIIGVNIFRMLTLDAMSSAEDALTAPLLAGIYEAVDAAGYDILIYSGWPDRPARSSGLDFLNGHIDGLLWVVPQADAPALARVAAAGLPTMGVLTRHVPPGVGYVNGDNLGAMLTLMNHLVKQGHRRIAFSGPIHSSNFSDRLEGYRQGLAAAGLPWDPSLEATSRVRQPPQEIYGHALSHWLAQPDPPTAIVLSHDYMAAGMAEALQAQGLRVPEDIALTGFDDIPAAQTLCGGLTTIRQPFHQIGQVATENLIALIEGASVETARVTLPLSLVVRASTSKNRLR